MMKFVPAFLFCVWAVVGSVITTRTTAFMASPSSRRQHGYSSRSPTLNLAVGEVAPDFCLVDQNGKKIKRSDAFKNKPLVVYFYPADATPGCTQQATGFNNAVREIRNQYGADVVGISGQDVASKQAFAKELGLSFSILADPGDAVRKAFGVPKAALGLFPGRVTYVLDKNGVCQKVYDDLANAMKHVEVAKAALQQMKNEASRSLY